MTITREPASPAIVAALRALAGDESLAAHLINELLTRTNTEGIPLGIYVVEPALFVVSPIGAAGYQVIEGPRPGPDAESGAATTAHWVQFIQLTADVIVALEDDLRRCLLPRHLRKRNSPDVRDRIVNRIGNAVRDKNPLIARRPFSSRPAT